MSPHPQNPQSKHEHELSEFELAEFKQAFEEFDKVSLKNVVLPIILTIFLPNIYLLFLFIVRVIKNLNSNKTAGRGVNHNLSRQFSFYRMPVAQFQLMNYWV